MGEFLMPSLGADMEAGTVVEWKVHPGDVIHRGDVVAVIDTDKSDIDVEVFEDGVIEELLVAEGRAVDVGTPLARIGPLPADGAPVPRAVLLPAAVPEPVPPPEPTVPEPEHAAPAPVRAVPAPVPAPPEHVRASPYARRLAAGAGADLGALAGSGPDRAVLARDVARAPAEEDTRPRRGADERRAAMRQAIADLMARSKREVPHYYLATTVDLAAAMRWLADRNASRPVAERVLPAALLLKAAARAAREVPELNGFWREGFDPAPSVHLGVAVSLRGGGLVAPAVHDADRLSIDEVMAALKDLVGRARAGRLRSSEMSDPTITVTNLGDEGADEVYGVIYPPQVALVGFGKVAERPWAVDGLLGVRPTVRVTLSADHRACDGHLGSRFLAAIDRLLQAPEEL
jgi:pyruvate dehydrogenase E2 component (dihydrolipoamide acetyltransferase)